MGTRDRLRAIDWKLILLRGVESEAAKHQAADLYAERRQVQKEVLREQEVRMSRDKARALRKAFREQYAAVAQRYEESQSERYPIEYRQREGAAILKELNLLDATLSRDMLLWHYGQKVEAARLRASDPVADPATETRHLREQLEADALADRYPTKIEARNHLLPEAWRLLNAGNIDRAQMYAAAARKRGAEDGTFDRDVNRLLDATVPHRRQAVEIEVMAADEIELSRRDAAAARLAHKIGTPVELVRASNTVQMADYKRQREAPILKEELGIELPASTD